MRGEAHASAPTRTSKWIAREVGAQSDRSVRGMRVQKLRCDEVELFDREVWQAAQLTTRSLDVNTKPRSHEDARRTNVRGTVEVFSTMHRPHGLMQEILEGAAGKKVFAWCLFRM